jgi:hypothetical protein
LTTVPHQDIPSDSTEPQPRRSIISPSLSSADENEEDADERRRSEMSPSPEIDLTAPELDDEMDIEAMGPPTPAGSFSGRSSLARDGTSAMITHNHRAVSPPLQEDEREFTQTASSMQRKRSASRDSAVARASTETAIPEITADEVVPPRDETEESAAIRNSEAAAVLFGPTAQHEVRSVTFSSPLVKPAVAVSSPVMQRRSDVMMELDTDVNEHSTWDWDGEMRSPENVELEELDDLLGGL